MTAHSTLAEFGARGVQIEVDGSELVVSGADQLTDAEVERLREMKGELIALLRQNDSKPADLTQHIEALRSQPCQGDLPPERFERLHKGAVRFAVEWGTEARRLGWGCDELFALAEPFARVDLQGAAWFVGDATVTGVTAAAITVRTPSGATQRIYRRSLQ